MGASWEEYCSSSVLPAESINHELEIFGKNYLCSENAKSLFLPLFTEWAITVIYIVLGLMSSLEMVSSMRKDLHQFCANTAPF